jgi:hypothetical protein
MFMRAANISPLIEKSLGQWFQVIRFTIGWRLLSKPRCSATNLAANEYVKTEVPIIFEHMWLERYVAATPAASSLGP